MEGSLAGEAIKLAKGEKGYHIFALSLLDGFHSMTLVLDNRKPESPSFILADHTDKTEGWKANMTATQVDEYVTVYSSDLQSYNAGGKGKTFATIAKIDDLTPKKYPDVKHVKRQFK